MVEDTGLKVIEVQGTWYNPVTNEFSKIDWLGNNYMLAAKRFEG